MAKHLSSPIYPLTEFFVLPFCGKQQADQLLHRGTNAFFNTIEPLKKWDLHCTMNDDSVSDTIRRRGGYRGMIREEEVDTGAYFRGNYGSRVRKSRNVIRSIFSRLKQAGTNLCMFNGIPKLKF